MAGHVYWYSGTIVAGDRNLSVDGQNFRENGQPLSEAELIAASLDHVRQNCDFTGHLAMRNFLYTDVGFLSDVDPTDTDEDDTDKETGQ